MYPGDYTFCEVKIGDRISGWHLRRKYAGGSPVVFGIISLCGKLVHADKPEPVDAHNLTFHACWHCQMLLGYPR